MPGMRTMGRVAWLSGAIALVLAATMSAAWATDDAPPPTRTITYGGDVLSVRLSKVPADEVLQELSRQSGAEIRGQMREPREVSAEFDSVPFPQGLARLLGDQNFALVYGQDGKLRAIKLLSAMPGEQAAVAPVTTAAAAAVPPPSPGALVQLMDQHLPVPVSGRVAQVLGSESASLRQLMDLGLHNEDVAVRREALHAGLQVLETEPELRASFVGTLNGMSETDLAQFLRGIAGQRAEELAQHLATQSRVSELRVKMSGVLRQFRTGS